MHPDLKTIHLDGLSWEFLCLFLDLPEFNWCVFVLLQYSSGVFVWHPSDLQVSQHIVSVKFSTLLHYQFYLWLLCNP